MSVYPDKICHLQLNSRHIILFRLKSHHFRTYFVYMIRYNNVSRPPATLHDLPSPKSGVVTFQTPRIELSPVFIQSRLFNSKHSFAGVWIHKPPLYYAHEYGDEVVRCGEGLHNYFVTFREEFHLCCLELLKSCRNSYECMMGACRLPCHNNIS